MSASLPNTTTTHADGSLEFPCQGCARSLRVPGTALGKQAKCPHCGAVQLVPAPGAPNPSALQTMQPQPTMSFSPTAPSEANRANGDPASWSTNASAANATSTSAPTPGSIFAPQPTAASPAPVAPPPIFAPQAQAVPVHEGRDTPTKRLFDRITREIAKIYVGQDELVLGALTALFSNGHVLIESVPGLGKTLFVRTLGRVLGLKFGRIQFTADLMPSDITGAPIFDLKQQEFRFRPGPVFTQLLLADEINRSPAKTHAALLEIMQEYHVTIDGVSHPIERPFLVLATQNPIESEGTYNLPEAQLDRFMFKLIANYPSEREEAEILKLHSQQRDIEKRLEQELQTLTSQQEIMETIRSNSEVRIDEKLVDYINKVVRRTRQWPEKFYIGASPRAGLSLMQAARTLAAFHGRDYAVPDDVVQIALPALRHRVSLTAEAEVEGNNVDTLLAELIRSVEVPRL
jgi:MoxR-like ATPase